MTDPTLTLTATVPAHDQPPMVVECDYTRHHYKCRKGWLRDSEALGTEKCPACGDTDHPGTRRLRYEVRAEVEIDTAYDSIFDSTKPVLKCCGLTADFPTELATALLKAHRAGETLPGVEITEVSDETDEH